MTPSPAGQEVAKIKTKSLHQEKYYCEPCALRIWRSTDGAVATLVGTARSGTTCTSVILAVIPESISSMLLNRYRGLEGRHDRPSVFLQAGGTSSSGAGLARDVRAIPIKVITVSKGNSPGANLMAEEWMEKVWEGGA